MNTYVNVPYLNPIFMIQLIMIMLFRCINFVKIGPNMFTLMPLRIYHVPPKPIPNSIHQPHSNPTQLIDLKYQLMS